MTVVLNRQKSGRLNVARVALLSIAVSFIVGFSSPDRSARLAQTLGEPAAAEATAGTTAGASAYIPTEPQPLPVIASLEVPPSRPGSYAEDPSLNSVLGTVSSRYWLKPSLYSPDRVRNELLREQTVLFRGVGFPDIQTHRKRQPFFDPTSSQPNQWNQLITWRARAGEQPAEPIAHVRCMGLSPQAVARRADRFESLILGLALEHEVSASLIKAVVTEESCFNAKALSPAGAQGLMQLMPDTATWLKVNDPNDPQDNLQAGVRYLAYLQDKFDSTELVLAAYNAGPGNVRRYGGIPPFAETQAYVQKVQANYRRYAAATRLAARQL